MALPPLILLHGYPFDHTLWDAVVSRLGQKTKVIAPDLPGFGCTPVSKAQPSIDFMADYVRKIADGEKAKTVVVAGMSMGGYVALAFAERHAQKLAGLGLVSTHCWADTDEARKGRRDMIAKVKKEGEKAALAAALPKLFADINANNEVYKKFPTEGARKAGPEGIAWALEAMAQRPDRSSVVQDIKCPLLVFHGTEDKFMPIDRARQMAALSPKAEFVEAKGAGHSTPLEATNLLAESLQRLLQRAG